MGIYSWIQHDIANEMNVFSLGYLSMMSSPLWIWTLELNDVKNGDLILILLKLDQGYGIPRWVWNMIAWLIGYIENGDLTII